MPDDENAAGAAVLERAADADQPAAQQPTGDSGSRPTPPEHEHAMMNDVFRARSGASSTSKPDDADTDGGSAPQGDVKPSMPERGADGKFVPRRGVAAALADVEQREAALDPAALREQVRAEVLAEEARKAESSELDTLARTRAADVARYRHLIEQPDADLSGEDYAWREQFKDKLKALPEVEQLHRELSRQAIEAERGVVAEREQTFLSGMAAQMGRVGARYGVETAAPGATFETIAEAIASAVEARVRSEYRDLEHENRQLRLTGPNGLASARTGLNGGMSNGAPPPPDMNARLRAALGGRGG